MITFESKGNFEKTSLWLDRMSRGEIFSSLEQYGAKGAAALASVTPKETGETSQQWSYQIERANGSYSIVWTNDKVVAGVPLVIMLTFGHGTGTGGYVQGRDFINPAIQPIFDQIANDVWKVVTS